MTDPNALAERLLAGDRRALARAISTVEDSDPAAMTALLHPHGGHARIVGITGAPGSGKSTLTDRLISHARAAGLTVAVLAIDPSSPFTGGAVLGDRIRMQEHVSDAGVYIRSMSTRGALGGLSSAAEAALIVLDAAGFDLLVVETVGVGQSEVDIMGLVETTVVVVAPGFGDGIQAAKAGVLEIGDVFVVNKTDLPGADSVIRDLTQMLELGVRGSWVPPIVSASGTEGSGIEQLWEAIDSHARHIGGSEGENKRRDRAALSIRRALISRLAEEIAGADLPPELVEAVLAREVDPWEAAGRIRQVD